MASTPRAPPPASLNGVSPTLTLSWASYPDGLSPPQPRPSPSPDGVRRQQGGLAPASRALDSQTSGLPRGRTSHPGSGDAGTSEPSPHLSRGITRLTSKAPVSPAEDTPAIQEGPRVSLSPGWPQSLYSSQPCCATSSQ